MNAENGGKANSATPEKSMRIQFVPHVDIIRCCDCGHLNLDCKHNREEVEKMLPWAEVVVLADGGWVGWKSSEEYRDWRTGL